MKRRQFVGGLVLTAAAGMAQEHAQHSHGAARDMLIHTASDCVVTGEVCLAHIHEMLAQGDKALAPCARSVSELTAVCEALRALAAQNAPALAKQAAVAMDVCNRCEAECRKHEKTHSPCKNCADACAACSTECRKMA